MKIIFVIKALGAQGGGAERVLSQVASGLADRGHEVTVFTNDSPFAVPYYHINESVRVRQLGIGDTKTSATILDTLRRMRCYRAEIIAEQPDVVVAFMHSTFVPVGISLLGSQIPVIASEHIGPEHYLNRPLQRLLLQLVPLLAKRITVVSTQIYQSFGSWLRSSMVVMPNPVVVQHVPLNKASLHNGCKILLSVGRLAEQKRQKILIDAFARIAWRHPDWILRIVGEGELRGALERQITRYGLKDQIQIPGAVSAIDAEYDAADLFVLASSYESFGLATAEALLHGLPAIGFADCPGTNELISDGVNGRLVRGSCQVGSLASVLDELMSNQVARQALANASAEEFSDRFGLQGVLDCWENLFTDVVGKPK